MSKSLLEQLSEHTVVVADTGDIKSIEKYSPRDATTNPSLLTAAAQMTEYQDIVSGALLSSSKAAGSDATNDEIVSRAIDRLSVDFGLRILDIVPGRVSTEVDARLSFDTEGTITKGRRLIELYEEAGASRDRVLIKIASTWQGIRAAEVLEKEGIHCNLTLLFGLHQAVAAAEAGATLISPFVGRIFDYYVKKTGREGYAPEEDPGVRSVTRIYEYFKKHGFETEIMGASFRNIDQIQQLCGCDLLTIAPKLLAVLETTEAPLSRKLDPETAKASDLEKIDMDEQTFRKMHLTDEMARVKLQEGIEGFSKAIVALEGQLLDRLGQLQGQAAKVATDLFDAYDLDGDGFITREEWAGSDAVFDALDVNGDGCITPSELAAGLGAAHRLRGS